MSQSAADLEEQLAPHAQSNPLSVMYAFAGSGACTSAAFADEIIIIRKKFAVRSRIARFSRSLVLISYSISFFPSVSRLEVRQLGGHTSTQF